MTVWQQFRAVFREMRADLRPEAIAARLDKWTGKQQERKTLDSFFECRCVFVADRMVQGGQFHHRVPIDCRDEEYWRRMEAAVRELGKKPALQAALADIERDEEYERRKDELDREFWS